MLVSFRGKTALDGELLSAFAFALDLSFFL
jgi:hypothetical protein